MPKMWEMLVKNIEGKNKQNHTHYNPYAIATNVYEKLKHKTPQGRHLSNKEYHEKFG